MSAMSPEDQKIHEMIDERMKPVNEALHDIRRMIQDKDCNCTDKAVMPEETIIRRKQDTIAGNMGQEANAGYANDDSTTSTRLLDKNWSPLIVRKYQHKGWPLFISLICDANLNDLDDTVLSIAADAEKEGFTGNTIQGARNFCGYMSDRLNTHYGDIKTGVTEGIAVLWYIDKCFISSLYGDFMTHHSCKMELFKIINTLPHI